MSPRITRAAARLSAGSTSSNGPTSPSPAPPTTTTSRKRKANRDSTSAQSPTSHEAPATSTPRRTKKAKLEQKDSQPDTAPAVAASSTRGRKAKGAAAMSNAGPSSRPSEDTSTPSGPASSSSKPRKSTKKKGTDSTSQTAAVASSSKKTRRSSKAKAATSDALAAEPAKKGKAPNGRSSEARKSGKATADDDAEELSADRPGDHGDSLGSEDSEGMLSQATHDDDDMDEDEDEDDPFAGTLAQPPLGLSSTLRALSGMMSGVSSRMRSILEQLKQKDDPSIQLIALQELSELLLVSTEDNLAGHFSPDQYVKELVALMQPSDFGEENPEMMLLACRCIANLMEALPSSTANVVYGGAVPILCQKLLEIHYIDLAEQSLSTLEKISAEFPASIVREGGLTACLTYLDFFPTSTQRTAVTTAANCCRNIPEESFPVVRDVMPILLNVLGSSDQKVVEQGCLCVSRLVESFKFNSEKLEQLVSADLLKAVLRLILPGTTNLIGAHIHTLFLRVLAFTARASPTLSAELLKMNVVDTLYQILTGVSPPSGTENVASKIDSVVLTQALIHRPKSQIFETLNVICELLPGVPKASDDGAAEPARDGGDADVALAKPRKSVDKRLELISACPEELKRFAVILLPTLTDAYSSTVNLSVRQRVLVAQLKMLSNLKTDILNDALQSVQYASFLASILSQQDHTTLVSFALKATELLLHRLEHIYRYQFHREGVFAEIRKLASRPIKTAAEKDKALPKVPEVRQVDSSIQIESSAGEPLIEPDVVDNPQDDEMTSADEDDMDNHMDDQSDSGSSSSSMADDPLNMEIAPTDDAITALAKRISDLENKDVPETGRQANAVLEELKRLAKDIQSCFDGDRVDDIAPVFDRLAQYFDGDDLKSITSHELLTSEIMGALLNIFDEKKWSSSDKARALFLRSFMNPQSDPKSRMSTGSTHTSFFSVLVKKLQDLLSRAEHFEVITVNHNAMDSSRTSAASMLAKQLRVKLVADDESGIPRAYSNIMVSIHAIATFKALDDYLRPRINMAEKPRSSRTRESMSSAIAAYTAALAARGEYERGLLTTPPAAGASDATNKTTKKPSSKSKASDSGPAQAGSSSIAEMSSSSSKKPAQKNAKSKPATPARQDGPLPDENLLNALECADETQINDESEADEQDVLDSIVDDLEEELEDEDLPDPFAVNMEIASTGRVTARKDDGTRIPTPQQNNTPSRPHGTHSPHDRLLAAAAQHYGASPSRPTSYAAAIQSVPQDWHIGFSVNGQDISHQTTVYRAVHFNQSRPSEISARNIWSTVHTFKFKRIPGPAPAETTTAAPIASEPLSGLEMPQSLDKNPTTSAILRLLSILHGLNSNLDDALASDDRADQRLSSEPLSQFVNTKLTAKLNRQLEEPLIVASSCLPNWSEDLARLYPFLFPFETRHLFLQATSFGYSRSMARWQNSQSSSDSRHDRHRDTAPFLGRLQRQKVRISRLKILESAMKVMELYGDSSSMLEVEYFDEVGTGLGPTLEFYSTVSREFSKKKLKLWRENESSDNQEYAYGLSGLFPAPMNESQAASENGKRILHMFKMMGKFVARSMMDSRIIDISFNPAFFRIGAGDVTVKPSLGAVHSVDASLARALRMLKKFAKSKKRIDADSSLSEAQKIDARQSLTIDGSSIDDFGLDFTLPGYASIELCPSGGNIMVNLDNVGLYVDQVLNLTIGEGVRRQAESFAAGFSEVFPYKALHAFTPDELVMLFGQTDEDWSLETLMDSVKADHGFNLDSKTIKNLLQTMSEYTRTERRDFLQFVTGSPKLPIGGFKSLTPMLTVVCKPAEAPYTPDDYLPSVMTCVNYLKMPDFTSMETLQDRLRMAVREGQGAFHLS